jgi:hypothetical protein
MIYGLFREPNLLYSFKRAVSLECGFAWRAAPLHAHNRGILGFPKQGHSALLPTPRTTNRYLGHVVALVSTSKAFPRWRGWSRAKEDRLFLTLC